MDEPSTNPYAPPTADSLPPPGVDFTDLRPLWIWLAISAAIALLGTPADPISQLVALAYGLAFFCGGSILASRLPIVIRVVPLLLWLAPAGWLASSFGHVNVIIGAMIYALVSIVMGHRAHRSIHYRRGQILGAFYCGYVVGSLAGILGTIGGAVLMTLITRHYWGRGRPETGDQSEEERLETGVNEDRSDRSS